ncbi:LINE-1 retrotransposable element ORF2 protein [Linum grandiflorum]
MLSDLPPSGPLFTWTNRQTLEVKSRLDRFLISPSWLVLFPHSAIQHLSDNGSDHRPILLTSDKLNFGPKKYFNFDSRWISNSEADTIISSSWKYATPTGSKLFKFHSKLKHLRHNLVTWQKNGQSNSARKILTLKEEITRTKLTTPPNWKLIRSLESDLEQALRSEDSYWKTKARNQWLSQGDRNTKYFHRIASFHRNKMHIGKLKTDEGTFLTSEEDKQLLAVNYFKRLFSSDIPPGFFPVHLCPSLSKSVSKTQNDALIRQVSFQEIKQAVFSLGPNQAPGLDGFTGTFYREYWKYIHPDLCGAVRSFFVTGIIPCNINHTLISLIPKIHNPSSMSHLRPISLCQFLYKIIAKILANRLALVLPSLIGSHQTGFVKDRRITDNIIIAHELMHFLKRKRNGASHYMALKLDMEKAYDRIEWGFLFEMLHRFGFHRSFTSWIQACITSVTYSVNFNGIRVGYFKPSRGLRQGDPLSPLLFAIVSEGLSALFKAQLKQGCLKGIKIARSAPVISHLFFADDTFLFLKVDADSISSLKHLFERYQRISGQKINFNKSAVYFSHNTPQPLQEFYGHILGVQSIGHQDKYLGIPSLVPRSKRTMFRDMEDKLRKKLAGWKTACLSAAGKETLIKSVISAFPSYMMNCFLLPAGLCKKFNSIVSRFWWSNKDGSKPIHWVSWKTLTKPKAQGGLGFRDFRALNLALLAKQGWWLATVPNSLAAKVLKGKYFPSSSFLKAKTSATGSWIWQSLLRGRELLLSGVAWQFGDGHSFNFLEENWLFDLNPSKPIIETSAPLPIPSIHHFLDRGWWNKDLLSQFFSSDSVRTIIRTPIPITPVRDSLVWCFSNTGIFSVKSAYHRAIDLGYGSYGKSTTSFGPFISDSAFWKSLWLLAVPPKIKVFTWKCFSNALPLRAELRHRFHIENHLCPVCLSASEDRDHLLLNCVVARKCIEACFPQHVALFSNFSNIALLWRALFVDSSHPAIPNNLAPKIAFLWWRIWKNRNDVLYNGLQWSINSMINKVTSDEIEFNTVMDNDTLNPKPIPHLASMTSASSTQPSWVPPPMGWIKINSDASTGRSGKGGAVGWVEKDARGHLFSSGARVYRGLVNVETLEALGIRDALLWAIEKGLPKIILENDNKGIICQIQQGNCANLLCGAILAEICALTQKTEKTVFRFSARSANSEADAIARQTLMNCSLY